MKFGVVYSQVELGDDPQAVHDIGVGIESAGSTRIEVTLTPDGDGIRRKDRVMRLPSGMFGPTQSRRRTATK